MEFQFLLLTSVSRVSVSTMGLELVSKPFCDTKLILTTYSLVVCFLAINDKHYLIDMISCLSGLLEFFLGVGVVLVNLVQCLTIDRIPFPRLSS